MNLTPLRRTTSLGLPGALLLTSAVGLSGKGGVPAQAAPAKPAATSNTLTFRVTARYGAKDIRDGSVTAQQSLDAKVFAKGQKARVETTYVDRPMVLLLAPPYVYRLLPQAKAGVRYQLNGEATQALNATSLAAFLRNPATLRTLLRQNGAKLNGTQVVNGEKLEVWTAEQFAKRPAQVKAWLRPADALPARLTITSRTVDLTASWRDYRKGTTLADSLFAVPSGFRVRDSQDGAAPL